MYLLETIIAPRSGIETAYRKSIIEKASSRRNNFKDRHKRPAFDDCDYMIAGEMRDPVYFGRISAARTISHKCLESHFKHIEDYL
jgi:hypothetical protein